MKDDKITIDRVLARLLDESLREAKQVNPPDTDRFISLLRAQNIVIGRMK